jgi:hypothetical protein
MDKLNESLNMALRKLLVEYVSGEVLEELSQDEAKNKRLKLKSLQQSTEF